MPTPNDIMKAFGPEGWVEENKKMYCDLCKKEGEFKNILKNHDIQKKDGSDVVVCDDCLNDYANEDYDSLLLRAKQQVAKNAGLVT